jgi:hypothetical protein
LSFVFPVLAFFECAPSFWNSKTSELTWVLRDVDPRYEVHSEIQIGGKLLSRFIS